MRRPLAKICLAFSLAGLPAACVSPPQGSDEVTASKLVAGVKLRLVERIRGDDSTRYGALDPAEQFHYCGDTPCDQGTLMRIAQSYKAQSFEEADPGGGSGGGSM